VQALGSQASHQALVRAIQRSRRRRRGTPRSELRQAITGVALLEAASGNPRSATGRWPCCEVISMLSCLALNRFDSDSHACLWLKPHRDMSGNPKRQLDNCNDSEHH
jgi:hypothetical protein